VSGVFESIDSKTPPREREKPGDATRFLSLSLFDVPIFSLLGWLMLHLSFSFSWCLMDVLALAALTEIVDDSTIISSRVDDDYETTAYAIAEDAS